MPRWKLPPDLKIKFSVSADELGQVVPWGLTYLGIPALQKKTRGAGIRVAVLDTGIDASHEDFAGAILAARDFTNSPNGAHDLHGHGTHTAGTIGSRDNGRGILPIAPECQLLIAKVLGDDGTGGSESISAGLRWVVDEGATIISMSLGAPEGDDVMREGLEYAVKHGVLVIGAAGNVGPAGVGYPAAWNDMAQAIAAIDQQGRIAGFSSQGSAVDVCAPGVHVVSCWPGNRYTYMDGTSMACPHVAGGLALVQAYRKQNGLPVVANQAELDKAIHATAKATAAVPSPTFGYGLFNPAAMCDYGVTAPPTGQKMRVSIGTFLAHSWELVGTPLVNK
jgi:subtilisin